MSNILLIMSGSIACEKAAKLISAWHDRGDKVRLILTSSAQNFIADDALELALEKTYTNTFAAGEEMAHIDLGHWADQIVVAPATANLINKLAAGIADDMASTTLLAAYGLNKPVFIAPAMNTRMLEHPATQSSLYKLHGWGYKVLPTGVGALACGELGQGRLAEPGEIMAWIDADLSMPGKGRLLITIGGTREAIDSVRYIGNSSSGATGSKLADYFSQAGYAVTAVCAKHGNKPQLANCLEYLSFEDLAQLLESQLAENEYTAVIHTAAVSDYSVAKLLDADGEKLGRSGKLSSKDGLQIVLAANPKLLNQLRAWSKNSGVKVVAFKLTDSGNKNAQQAAIMQLLQAEEVDAVVHNDLAEIDEQQHLFHFYYGAESENYSGAMQLAAGLEEWLEERK